MSPPLELAICLCHRQRGRSDAVAHRFELVGRSFLPAVDVELGEVVVDPQGDLSLRRLLYPLTWTGSHVMASRGADGGCRSRATASGNWYGLSHCRIRSVPYVCPSRESADAHTAFDLHECVGPGSPSQAPGGAEVARGTRRHRGKVQRNGHCGIVYAHERRCADVTSASAR